MSASRWGKVTRALAEYGATLAYERLPRAVTEFAKLCVIDQIGCQLFLATLPASKIVHAYVEKFAGGASTVVYYGTKLDPERAAFANAVFGHAFELDDYNHGSLNHPGPAVVPAALAMAEANGCSGRDVIQAVVAGYEVMGRIGRGVTPSIVLDRGFHPQSAIGPFGAAVAAGRLLRFGPDTMANALGLAASHSSGTVEYIHSWGETTRMHAGLAASSGIRSALLAGLGYLGPGEPIEGRCGFARAFAERCDLDVMVADLGEAYTMTFTGFRIRPYNAIVHCAVDVALEALGGRAVTPADIERVDLGGNRHMLAKVAAHLTDLDATAETSMTAVQWSLHMPVAHALLYGGGLDSVLAFDGRDPAVRALAKKVTVELDPECEREYDNGGHRGPKVKVRAKIAFADGSSHEASNFIAGSPENRLSAQQLCDKFVNLASRVVPARQAQQALDLLRHLEDVKDMRQLIPFLIA